MDTLIALGGGFGFLPKMWAVISSELSASGTSIWSWSWASKAWICSSSFNLSFLSASNSDLASFTSLLNLCWSKKINKLSGEEESVVLPIHCPCIGLSSEHSFALLLLRLTSIVLRFLCWVSRVNKHDVLSWPDSHLSSCVWWGWVTTFEQFFALLRTFCNK